MAPRQPSATKLKLPTADWREVLEIREANQTLVARWILLGIVALWLTAAAVGFSASLYIVIARWAQGEIADIPSGIIWLLGGFLGSQAGGSWFMHRTIAYYFPKAD
jgi:hypothetical protein